jgi:large subunit ribosomal protein L31
VKPDIHPRYEPVAFRDRSTGKIFITRSTRIPDQTIELNGRTYPVADVDVTSDSHPFWTGRKRALDSEGRIEAFHRRYGTRGQE